MSERASAPVSPPPDPSAGNQVRRLAWLADLDRQADERRAFDRVVLVRLERQRERLGTALAAVELGRHTLAHLLQGDGTQVTGADAERMRTSIRARERECLRWKRDLAEEERRTEALRLALHQELGSISEMRAELARQLSPRLLARYEGVVQRGHEHPLVCTEGECCPACRHPIPAPVLRELEARPVLAICTSCQRLLCDRRWARPDDVDPP